MPQIHLIEGPVGAGKSTFAAHLAGEYGAPRFILDEWMVTLFRPDRPAAGVAEWYVERKARCVDQIWRTTCGLLEAGVDAVLELGLIQRSDRRRLYDRVDRAGYGLTIYVLDAPREIRWERVQRRNRLRGETFSMEVPEQFFAMASDMWEPLEESECRGRDVRFIATGTDHIA